MLPSELVRGIMARCTENKAEATTCSMNTASIEPASGDHPQAEPDNHTATRNLSQGNATASEDEFSQTIAELMLEARLLPAASVRKPVYDWHDWDEKDEDLNLASEALDELTDGFDEARDEVHEIQDEADKWIRRFKNRKIP